MSAGVLIIADKSGTCSTCGQQVIPGDRLIMIRRGTPRMPGSYAHELCARWHDGTDHNLPRLLWAQVDALRKAVHGLRLPDESKLRRLMGAIHKRHGERATAFPKGDQDAALTLGSDLYEGYLAVLEFMRTKGRTAGDYWAPRQANGAPWRDHREIKAQGALREEIREFREREAQVRGPVQIQQRPRTNLFPQEESASVNRAPSPREKREAEQERQRRQADQYVRDVTRQIMNLPMNKHGF